MTSSEKIHETIARMRRRVLELDALIARIEQQIERERIPVHENTTQREPVRWCRRTRRSG